MILSLAKHIIVPIKQGFLIATQSNCLHQRDDCLDTDRAVTLLLYYCMCCYPISNQCCMLYTKLCKIEMAGTLQVSTSLRYLTKIMYHFNNAYQSTTGCPLCLHIPLHSEILGEMWARVQNIKYVIELVLKKRVVTKKKCEEKTKWSTNLGKHGKEWMN